MAWNEDGWRLARETWDSTRRAALAVERAGTAIVASDPDLALRLNRAMGAPGRDLAAQTARIIAFPAELPTTEPEARRRLELARSYKTRFREVWGRLATDAREGRHDLVQADHARVMEAGVFDAEASLNDVPWPHVDRLLAIPMPGLPAPPVPRDPTRTPRRGSGIAALLPFLVIAGIMFAKR